MKTPKPLIGSWRQASSAAASSGRPARVLPDVRVRLFGYGIDSDNNALIFLAVEVP
jgi:hypothetical protein